MNVNVVVLTGNLTRDPELRPVNDSVVCKLRLAVNDRFKNSEGEWTDRPNYFNVDAWGGLGENCAQYLVKGRKVAVTGKLQWREWDATDGSGKRQEVSVRADNVEFLTPRGDPGETPFSEGTHQPPPFEPGTHREPVDDFRPAAAQREPTDDDVFQPAGSADPDADIPF